MKTFPNSQHGKSYFLFILIAAVAIGSGILVQTAQQPPAELPEFKKIILLPTTKELGPVNFTDHKGQKFGLNQLQGQWSILFFGFTNCPDVCPTTMQTLKQVKQDIGSAGVWNNFQVIMVSVDPERDTVERLNNYVPFFDPEFIGIKASIEHTTEFAKNVGILFYKSKQFDNGGYDVDHGAAIILINPQGKYAGVMTAPHIQTDMSADLIKLANYVGVKKNQATASESTPTNTQQPLVNAGKQSSLSIENAWIRPAPPQAPSMAAYFDIVNNTASAITIIGSSSMQFDNTMIHNTVIENGIASMSHMDNLVIPAGARISLSPGAKHMMLMAAKSPLKEGSQVDIQFETDEGQFFDFKVTVRQQPK
jgi:protein SCO1/2